MALPFLLFDPNSCIMTVSKPDISEHDSHFFAVHDAVLTRAEELYEHWESTWANVPKLAQFELGYKKEDVEWISIELLKVSPPMFYL
jgi:L-cysteine desulfidase